MFDCDEEREVTAATSQWVEREGLARPGASLRHPRLIRQASAWEPGEDPQPVPLQYLEDADAIGWVDLYGGDLDGPQALALLAPICGGRLTARMVRDLITPRRFPAGREYPGRAVSITAAFRTRHLQSAGGNHELGHVTSVFEPVHLLIGEGWLISCWLPPRVFRGDGEPLADAEDGAAELYRAVADSWPESERETAADLADLVRDELAIAAGYRIQARA
jgi:hypothetical protein